MTPFPAGFLWGAATAPHQVEGNNTSSDIWQLENAPGSILPERSGDACDSYHRWREDLDIVDELGLRAYRFGVEWARVEPAPGAVSRAELAHYRRMIEGCFERGITPVVTLHHFTSPAWFRAAGGWKAAGATDLFRRYVRSVLPILDGVEWVCTINEPNMVALMAGMLDNGERSELTAGAMPPPDQEVAEALVRAHRAAREELATLPGVRSGWTIANQVFQPAPGTEGDAAVTDMLAEWAWTREDQFIDAARGDDFVGVQAYTRTLIGTDGPQPADERAATTLTGWEVYPQALESALRHTAELVGPGTPLLVTENGIATRDDRQRIAYAQDALTGVERALADGVDVRGYLHWSLLDNYEWGSWAPTFGLVSVDRETFERTVKPSARWLGEVARANCLVKI